MNMIHDASQLFAGNGAPAGRSIGAILIDTGRLKPADAERILRLQREQGMMFGDAAKALGLLSEADIQFALSQQFDYPYLQSGQSSVATEVVAAYQPFSLKVEALRALRSQLMLRWFDVAHERKTLAIVSPDRREGRSWLASNLAVVFSQLGERTLLIDADLRNPSQHTLFGIENRTGLSTLLSGRSSPDALQRIPELLGLSVLPAGSTPPNPQELLARPLLPQLLTQFGDQFDVIILDTPPGSEYADGQTLSARAGAALMVARRDQTGSRNLRAYADSLRLGGCTVIGSILNNQ